MILYVSYRFEKNIGATIHQKILRDLYGEDNVYIVDLQMGQPWTKDKAVAFGKYKNKLDRIMRWAQGNTMYLSNDGIDKICHILGKFDFTMVFIEDSIFGNLAKTIKKRFPDLCMVAFYHDIAASLYRQKRKHKKGLSIATECTTAIRQEHIQQKYTDINLVFNERDAELFQKYYGKRPEGIVPLAVFDPMPENAQKVAQMEDAQNTHLLFVGAKYWPNIVGIRWFYNHVLPHLKPTVSVHVVGRGMEFLQEEFSDPRVKVHGTVEDLAMYYRNADICIAPLFDGGGMKAKTVEAISYAKCFVGTAESLMGCWEELSEDIQNRVVFRCDTAEEWITAVNMLADTKVEKFNNQVYQVFTEKFSYEANKKAFANLFKGEKVAR